MAETTSRPALPPTPTFAEFYQAINSRPPFPWQSRLAALVAETESWPAEVGVATGLGKTACLDIAVWWLASQADRCPAERTAPTRIWWLVNRRLLVDSTSEHAKCISKALHDPQKCKLSDDSAEVIAAVGQRLCSLSADPDAAPLEVIRLRGGILTRRPADPSRPAVVLSTLPMYGSRLLFRGYGPSRSMWPIDAALAGTDSLVIVDEAHLAPHLRELLPALAECTPAAEPILGRVRSRPTVVSLTATGDAPAGERFDLNDDDKAHPVVLQRLDAEKPMTLQVVKSGATGQLLAAAARMLLEQAAAPASCLVFANTPATARDAFRSLGDMDESGKAEILLLTGRAREREAGHVRTRILDRVHGMSSDRDSTKVRRQHLIVVATQTLEVGADVDAEHLVTEACGVRALTQRLGRLNRLGCYPHARAVYVHLPPTRSKSGRGREPDEWPVYGREPAEVLRRLEAHADNGEINLSPRKVAKILGPPNDDPGRAPEILQGLLWEWVKTTTPPDGAAPVEPYFSGIAEQDRAVSIIWRAYVPEEGELLWPRATDREAIDVPLSEAREALGEDRELRRLGTDGVTIETISPERLRPGNTVVLASDRGLMDEYGWDRNLRSSSPVVDLSILHYGLPLDPGALRRLFGDGTARDAEMKQFFDSIGKLIKKALGPDADGEDLDEADREAAVRELLEAVASKTPAGSGWEESEWYALVAALDRRVVTPRSEVARLEKRQAAREPRSDELDEMSRRGGNDDTTTAVELDPHGKAVAARAQSIAERLGLSCDLTAVVERAGRLHDLGKADWRFQRWLDPDGTQGVPVAKSQKMPRSQWTEKRIAAGWPRGGRHEELSARLVRRWFATYPERLDPSLADLLIHLVVSHHGFGRPLVVPVADYAPSPVCVEFEGAALETAADLSTIDWSQPARFSRLNDRFGPWGLALLEAIVRQADHTVSAGSRVAELELR